jgi:hypothetical protein
MLTTGSSIVLPFQPKPQPERFVMLRDSLLDSPEWQSVPPTAQALYVDVARKYNGRNNGHVRYSVSDGAAAFRVHKSTISRRLRLLEESGLIRCASRGSFNRKTKEAFPSEWELTKYRVAPAQLDNRVAAVQPSSCTSATSIEVDLKIDKKEGNYKERKNGNSTKEVSQKASKPREGFSPSNSSSLSPSRDIESAAAPGGVPRAAPNGNGGESVWVKYDTPTWDMVERFGHRAVGKVFMRYGRVEGHWILKADLRAIEAVANGGGP